MNDIDFSAVQRTEEFQKDAERRLFFCKNEEEWHETGKENILVRKISKLLMQFSIPTVLTLIVNCLYNIVDQIFVGRAGHQRRGSYQRGFPHDYHFGSPALTYGGDGCAANISLCLGRKERDKAEQTFGNAFVLLILAGVLLAAVIIIGGPACARLLGRQRRFWICL